jgi:hypothetical protein
MLGLGLATSHAPTMFQPAENWPKRLERLSPQVQGNLPYTAKVEMASPTIIQGYIDRINAGFGAVRDQLQAYKPDAIIMIGDDQGDMFDKVNNPTFAIYTGDEPTWGHNARDLVGTLPEQRTTSTYQNHGELARYLLKGLVKRGFDVANLAKFEPRGGSNRGMSHMIANVFPEIDPDLQVPIVPVFLNEYFPPLPSADRCIQLGEAIAEVMNSRPERIAICASGGLSHYPGNHNAGWIDQPLDNWFLERLERNDVEALKHLFAFDSDNVRAGTGEIRAWISVAAAMNRPAKRVDYIPAHCTLTGCGFVYWPARADDVVGEAERVAASASGEGRR